jgi:hypothetical protein
MFRGAFDTWEAAAASAPHSRPLVTRTPTPRRCTCAT